MHGSQLCTEVALRTACQLSSTVNVICRHVPLNPVHVLLLLTAQTSLSLGHQNGHQSSRAFQACQVIRGGGGAKPWKTGNKHTAVMAQVSQSSVCTFVFQSVISLARHSGQQNMQQEHSVSGTQRYNPLALQGVVVQSVISLARHSGQQKRQQEHPVSGA